MSQRHFFRRSPMELSSAGFQGERGTAPASDYPTAAEVSEDVASRQESSLLPFSFIDSSNSNNQWELQRLRREQDPLLTESSPEMNNKRFSLFDVGRETVHLSQVRRTFFFVFLATFTFVVLLQQVLTDSLLFIKHYEVDGVVWKEQTESCEQNILYPWRDAVIARNLTSAKQEEFYTLFKNNCSLVFRDPPEETGFFSFKNGTFKLNDPNGFAQNIPVAFVGGFVFLEASISLWFVWGAAAAAWGLLEATTTTMGYYSRPSNRDPLQMPSQKISDAFWEQFSYKVFIGFIRICLTTIASWVFLLVSTSLIAIVRSLVANNFADIFESSLKLAARPNIFWGLADPLPYLFLLSKVAAAVEPGVWGFKALWRGIQLGRGNRLKSYFIYLALYLLFWLDSYLSSLIELKPGQVMTESLMGILWRSILRSIFTSVGILPRFFLVPVLYFLCKAWREKVSTMA